MTMLRQFSVYLCLLAVLMSAPAAAMNVKVIALFTNKAMLNVDGEQKIISKGETFKGVKLISSSGRGAVVSIDGKQRKLDVNQSIQGNFKSAERKKSRIYPDSLGMYFVEGRINGHATPFLVDTGATYVTLSSRHAKKVGIDYKRGLPSYSQTATETVPVWQVKLKSITVGGIRLTNVEASVIEGSQPSTVLLGNSFLSRTQLQRKGTVMELQKRF
jgi:aspartyl protease family protein